MTSWEKHSAKKIVQSIAEKGKYSVDVSYAVENEHEWVQESI